VSASEQMRPAPAGAILQMEVSWICAPAYSNALGPSTRAGQPASSLYMGAAPHDPGGRSATVENLTLPARSPAPAPRAPQDKPVSYLHVGMVQHDPAGRIAFLHRTAEGKFHPLVRAFRRVHVVTVPLSPARAAATLGNRQRHMGFESLQARRPRARPRRRRRPAACSVGAAQ